jgi:hypothetical protein
VSAIRLSTNGNRRPVPALKANRVALRAYTALAMMSAGSARREEWLDLADSANIVEALIDMGKFDDASVRPSVDAAVAGLVVAMRCPAGMMRMGSAIKAMAEVVSLHDEAVSKFAQDTLRQAFEAVCERIYTAKAASDPGVMVVDG